MLLPTFADVQARIVSKARLLESCNALQAIKCATTFDELLNIGCGLYAWAYQVNVADDDVVESIPESNFNDYGIYTTNQTITNPQSSDYLGCTGSFIFLENSQDEIQELFFIGTSDSIINLDGCNSAAVWVMGSANLVVNISANSSIHLKLYNNSTATINATGDALCCLEANENSFIDATFENDSILNASLRHNSILNYVGTDNSYAQIKTFAKSYVGYLVDDPSMIKLFKYNSSVNQNLFV